VGLALACFRAEQLPESLAEIPLEYFETAIRWLRRNVAVSGRPLGVMGTSRGGDSRCSRLEVRRLPGGGGLRAECRPCRYLWRGLREATRWTYHGKAAQPFIASREADRMEEPAPSPETRVT